ncbi:MAG: tRNA-binding protein [Synergistales bacterium]|nr:tRNA-binding protein [Synergistales bacterium]
MTDKIRHAPVKPEVTIADLEKLDIRVGTILKVEDLPRSDKIAVLTVDFGDHTRTILAGIREEREDPTEIEGKQALFVVNMKPRKISGMTSQGMLYDIGYADGIKPALAMPERPVPNGSRLG